MQRPYNTLPNVGGNFLEDFLFRLEAGNARDFFSAFEQYQRGDAEDAKTHHNVAVRLGVEHSNSDFAIILRGDFPHERLNSFTWTTPFRPKIHQNRRIRLQ